MAWVPCSVSARRSMEGGAHNALSSFPRWHANAAEAVGQALKAGVTNALKETLSALVIYRSAAEPGAAPVATVLVVRRAAVPEATRTAVGRVGVVGEPP